MGPRDGVGPSGEVESEPQESKSSSWCRMLFSFVGGRGFDVLDHLAI